MNGREAALMILERCRRDDAWFSAAADGIIRKAGLERREASLASALALGVLQNRGYYDFILSSYCSRRPDQLEARVLDILRLGVCQLLLLDRIPVRAAVNETVALCRSCGAERASALVNAVLRRVAEDREKLPEVPNRGEADYLAVRYSEPLWLSEKLVAEKGSDKKFGARPIRRAVQTMLEDTLAAEILEGKIKEGDEVAIRAKGGKIFVDIL